MFGIRVEQGYDLKLCDSKGGFCVVSNFMLVVELTSYSTAATRNYSTSPDCGGRTGRLTWSSVCFFVSSAVDYSFFSRLKQRISRERWKKNLRPSKYCHFVAYLTSAVLVMKIEASLQIKDKHM